MPAKGYIPEGGVFDRVGLADLLHESERKGYDSVTVNDSQAHAILNTVAALIAALEDALKQIDLKENWQDRVIKENAHAILEALR